MFDLQSEMSSSQLAGVRPQLAIIDARATVSPPVETLIETRIDAIDALVVTKLAAGFDDASILRIRQILDAAASGHLAPLKFLVFDFAHDGVAGDHCPPEFADLVRDTANLILHQPIVMVANARAVMGGADLEFALACSVLIGEAHASFSFDVDPVVSIGVYGFLAQKLGFVRAERLMENGERLDAQQMHDLLLLKTVNPTGSSRNGIVSVLERTLRRHNSSCGIFRAHRMAVGGVGDALRAYG